jgi:hypothetical protein
LRDPHLTGGLNKERIFIADEIGRGNLAECGSSPDLENAFLFFDIV